MIPLGRCAASAACRVGLDKIFQAKSFCLEIFSFIGNISSFNGMLFRPAPVLLARRRVASAASLISRGAGFVTFVTFLAAVGMMLDSLGLNIFCFSFTVYSFGFVI